MMAGYGTRRLPITKALEKCMLPVGNRPVVDYKIEECIRAGITEFILVVGEEFDQVKSYYGQNLLLEEYLEAKGKFEELEELRAINKKARFHYVVQDQYQPYGTSTPVWLCRHLIKPDEKFLVLNGDDFTFREDGGSDLADMIKAAEEAGAQSAMLAQEVPWDRVSRYGILTIEEKDGNLWCKGIQEQPKQDEAASNLANPGSYYFDGKIFSAVERNVEQEFDREHRLTEAMNDYYLSEGNSLLVVKTKGEFLDCGNTEGWLHANQRIIGSKTK
jgi:UTP--glucose-1-phosphate uridylyltransferase